MSELLLSLDEYDERNPSAYYLKGGIFSKTADARLEVAGVELPVHTQMLAGYSSVLLEAFSIDQEVSQGQEALISEAPRAKRPCYRSFFEGFTVKDVAIFLRLFYPPRLSWSPQSLAAARQHLPAITRLAHKFDVGQLVSAAETCLVQEVEHGTHLNSSLQLAEELGLKRLLAVAVASTAIGLLSDYSSGGRPAEASHNGFMETAQLTAGVSSNTLQLILGAVAAAKQVEFVGAGAAMEALQGSLAAEGQPSPLHPALLEWVELRGGAGELSWVIPNFAAVAAAGKQLKSPEFVVGGQAWRVIMRFPFSQSQREDWVGISLEAVGAEQWRAGKRLKAMVCITIVNMVGWESVRYCPGSLVDFTSRQPSVGDSRLVPINYLMEDVEGVRFLVDGKLTVKAEVAV
ncbi:hypothetical protein N2152v2_006855 [Parachlorella kessleri]